MTRKRFVKKLMGLGLQRNEAQILAKGVKAHKFLSDGAALFILGEMPPDFFDVALPVFERRRF